MTLVNIDASEHLVRKVGNLGTIEFVLDVIHRLECDYFRKVGKRRDFLRSIPPVYPPHPLIPQRKLGAFGFELLGHELYGQELFGNKLVDEDSFGYEKVAVLLHNIPIILRESKPNEMPVENCIIENLGAYYSNRKGNSPYIELYLTAIDSSAKNENDHFVWLFTQVLIHELAHAALDIFNLEHAPQSEKVFYHTDFGRWREESMANAIALRIIKDYGNKDFYDYTKHFMQSQPKEYALGVLMEDFRYWDFRSVLDTKEQGVDSHLQQEWLNYAKGTPDWDGLNK